MKTTANGKKKKKKFILSQNNIQIQFAIGQIWPLSKSCEADITKHCHGGQWDAVIFTSVYNLRINDNEIHNQLHWKKQLVKPTNN